MTNDAIFNFLYLGANIFSCFFILGLFSVALDASDDDDDDQDGTLMPFLA